MVYIALPLKFSKLKKIKKILEGHVAMTTLLYLYATIKAYDA